MTTISQKEIINTVYDAVDEFNREHPADKQLMKSLETVLFGPSMVLDSLGLVSFIISTEQKLQESFGVSVTLADERAMAQTRSPFQSIGSLVAYIQTLIKDPNGNH